VVEAVGQVAAQLLDGRSGDLLVGLNRVVVEDVTQPNGLKQVVLLGLAQRIPICDPARQQLVVPSEGCRGELRDASGREGFTELRPGAGTWCASSMNRWLTSAASRSRTSSGLRTIPAMVVSNT
jgi:hypothetical protein